jgi:hypothetical protein
MFVQVSLQHVGFELGHNILPHGICNKVLDPGPLIESLNNERLPINF